MTVIDELVVMFKANITDVLAGTQKVKTEVADVGKKVNEVASSTKALSFIEAGRQIQSMGQGFTQNVSVPILGFFQDSIKASSNAAEEASKFAQVFKGDLGTQGESWVGKTATEMGRAESMIRSYAASFGAVLTPQFGENKKAALDLSEGYTKLAVDLSSFYNVSEEEAKTSLMSGIAGETEPMRRFGVMMNEAAVNAELLAMGINKTQKEASAAELQQARYNIIVRATSDAQGDAVRTSDGFANSMRAIEGTFEQVKVEIGNALMPVIMQVVGIAKEALAWFKELDPGIKQVAVVVGVLAAAIGPLLVVFGTLLGAVGSITAVLGAGGVGGALAALGGPVTIVVGAIALLAAAFAGMYSQSESLRNGIGMIGGAIIGFGQAAIKWIQPIIDLIVTNLMPILKEWGDFFGEQIQKVFDWANGDGANLITFLGQVADVIKNSLMVGLQACFDLYSIYIQPTLEWLLGGALDLLLGALGALGDWFMSPDVQAAIKWLADGLGWIWDQLGKLWAIIADYVIPTLMAFGKALKGDFAGAATDLQKAFKDAASGVTQSMRDVETTTKKSLKATQTTAESGGKQIRAALKTQYEASVKDVDTEMEKARQGLENKLGATKETATIEGAKIKAALKAEYDAHVKNVETSMTNAKTATTNGLDATGKAIAGNTSIVDEMKAKFGAIESAANTTWSNIAATFAQPLSVTYSNSPETSAPGYTANPSEGRTTGNPGDEGVQYGGPADTSNPSNPTIVRQWQENGYNWTQWSDGHAVRGAAVALTPGQTWGARTSPIGNAVTNNISVNVTSTTPEPASVTLAKANSVSRAIVRRVGAI